MTDTIAEGVWLGQTAETRIIEMRLFKYGWRAKTFDGDTFKETDHPDGLQVHGIEGKSLDGGPRVLPWPAHEAPIEHLEQELAEDEAEGAITLPNGESVAASDVPPSTLDYVRKEQEIIAEAAGRILSNFEPSPEDQAADTSVPAEVSPPAEVSEAIEPIRIVEGPDANGTIFFESGLPSFEPSPEDPPIGPSGYQPARGEGVDHIETGVVIDGVVIHVHYRFPQPRSLAEAQPAVADLAEWVASIEGDDGVTPTPSIETQSAVAPSTVPTEGDGEGASTPSPLPVAPPLWIGNRPQGKGSFRFVGTDHLSHEDFLAGAAAKAAELGLPADQLVVYDERIGPTGLEARPPGTAWNVGTIRLHAESPLNQQMSEPGRAVAYVSYNEDTGRHDVKPTKHGEELLAVLAGGPQ